MYNVSYNLVKSIRRSFPLHSRVLETVAVNGLPLYGIVLPVKSVKWVPRQSVYWDRQNFECV